MDRHDLTLRGLARGAGAFIAREPVALGSVFGVLLPRVLAVSVAVLLLAGCSTAAQTPATTTDPAAQLTALKKSVDEASSVRVNITSRDVPSTATGLLSLRGVGAHPPAFKGTASVRMVGITGDIDVIATGGQIWAKLPLVPGMKKIDAKALGVPDPADLLAVDTGLTSLITATTGAAHGARTRAGAEVLETITGKIPGRIIVDLFYNGDAEAQFDVRYGYLPAGQLRTVAITGPFFPPALSSYDVVLDEYGQPVDISPP